MFERHPVPTPFPVGPVNCYVAGRTVVDPGPDTGDAWAAVADALAEHELAPGDVDQVLLTHSHADHVGLARRFRDRGATVLAGRETETVLADYDAALERDESFFRELLPRHGMPTAQAETIASLSSSLGPFVEDCAVDRVLEAGDRFTVDSTEVTVDVVSGHAIDELVCAYEADGRRSAIVGDHVLDHITPNPLLHAPTDDSGGATAAGDSGRESAGRTDSVPGNRYADSPNGDRPRVLPAFNDSLETLHDRPFDRFLPGHGSIVDAPRERIEAIRRAHEDRTDAVATLVDGPTTAYEVMDGLFEDLPAQEQYPGMSEAIGHLDVLETRGAVEATTAETATAERADRIVYEPA